MEEDPIITRLSRDKGPIRLEKVEELLKTATTFDFIFRGRVKELTDAEVDECAIRETRISVLTVLYSEQRIRQRRPKTKAAGPKPLSELQDISDEAYKKLVKGLIYE